MTSRASFCNRTLLRKNIVRFAPLWGLYTLLLLLLLPAQLGVNGVFQTKSNIDKVLACREILKQFTSCGIFVSFPYAGLCAAASFGLLHKRRSAYMLHAFPLTRREIFGTGVVTGTLFGLAPMLLAMVFCFPQCLRIGATGFGSLFFGALFFALIFLFFFSLAVFCMHLTGKTVAAAGVYLLMNFLFLMLEWLGKAIVSPMLVGVTGGTSNVTEIVTPVYLLGRFYNGLIGRQTYGNESQILWQYLLPLVGVGVILLVCAWLLYRRRRMEMSGEIIVFRAAQPVCRLLMTILSALAFCVILEGAFGFSVDPNRLYGFIMTVLYLAAGAFLGWFGSEMLLKKSLRVFNARSFFGWAMCAVLLGGALGAVRTDLFRIVRYTPSPDRVKSVTVQLKGSSVSCDRIELTDRSQIEAFIELHEQVAQVQLDYQHEPPEENYDYSGEFQFYIRYEYQNGDTLSRVYSVRAGSAREEMSNSAEKILAFFGRHRATLYERLTALHLEESPAAWLYTDENAYELSSEEMWKIIACILADTKDGTLDAYDLFRCDELERSGIPYFEVSFQVKSVAYRDAYSPCELYIPQDMTQSWQWYQEMMRKLGELSY